MNMILKGSVFLLVMMLFAPLVAHSDVTGGGWIRGASGGKATFAVDINNGSGSFAYHDREFRSSDFPGGVNIVGNLSVFSAGGGVRDASGTYMAAQGGTSGFIRA